MVPPPKAPVRANSEVIDTKIALTAASNALPPNLNISFAARLASSEPVDIFPYFIKLFFLIILSYIVSI